MLRQLAVRDIVLIDRLVLDLRPGLTVLTGETGAGKSILLEALSLALGGRAEASLARTGAAAGVVAASFELAAAHPALALLDEQGLPREAELVLRRQVGADGRSRAHVNDQPVSVGLLRQLGDLLVEVHGQHDERGLMNPAGHRALLDAFGGHWRERQACQAVHRAQAAAVAAVAAAEAEQAAAARDGDYLRHQVAELDALQPRLGEEAALAEARQRMQQGARLGELLSEAGRALEANEGVTQRLAQVERALGRAARLAPGRLDAVLAQVERARAEAMEAAAQVEQAQADLELDPGRLERLEDRLFSLREAARKHRVPADGLADLREEMAARLRRIDSGEADLKALRKAASEAEAAFARAVAVLGGARAAAATRIDALVAAELPPLKLERARFATVLQSLPRSEWSGEGGERVAFQVATNQGAALGPLNRIASGGELSRFMLALKVALAGTRAATTLIFDEVDQGVGGAVADAVGERLARLAGEAQVLLVTHSPQVAARAEHHWLIAKEQIGEEARTQARLLGVSERREEIARMLAGAEVTPAARAAARSLLQAGQG
ncbi:MAG: DNA repair protein RecN [Alphaproteobacteria bacterium]|nr:DNA repair protein RecN [Alphaproteobacteria bacterium]